MLLMLLNCGVGEDSWESLGLWGDPTSPSYRRSVLGVHWKGWCWSWNSNTLATWCEQLTHWKRPQCWDRLRAVGQGDDRGWDGWMASPTHGTWVWVDSESWWWTGRPGILQFVGSQRVRHDWATEMNWTELWTSLGLCFHVSEMRVFTTAYFLLSIKYDDICESIWLMSKANAKKCVCHYSQWNYFESSNIVCVCVWVRTCVLMSSQSRTGPCMTIFALLNWQCNLILRLVPQKRILSLLNLRRALKMDGPSGTHGCVSTAT